MKEEDKTMISCIRRWVPYVHDGLYAVRNENGTFVNPRGIAGLHNLEDSEEGRNYRLSRKAESDLESFRQSRIYQAA